MYHEITHKYKKLTGQEAHELIEAFLSKNNVHQVILEGLHDGPIDEGQDMPRFKGLAVYGHEYDSHAILIAQNPFQGTGYGGELDIMFIEDCFPYMSEAQMDDLYQEHEDDNYLWVGENYEEIDTITYVVKVENNAEGAGLLTRMEDL